MNEYVLRGRRLWQLTETQGGSWSWNKLLRLRSLAQQFVERNEGRECWKFHGDRYRTAAVWEVLRPKNEKVAWHKLIWTSFVVPKHCLIAWMAILNRLPTKDRLRNWGYGLEGVCSLCKQENETRDHLFFECSYSKNIWQQVLGLCRLRRDVLDWSYELR